MDPRRASIWEQRTKVKRRTQVKQATCLLTLTYWAEEKLRICLNHSLQLTLGGITLFSSFSQDLKITKHIGKYNG